MVASDIVSERAAPLPRFNGLAILLHWLTVVLIVGVFASAWMLGAAQDGGQATLLLQIHRSLGISVWWVSVLRFGWRRWGPALPPFPASMPRPQRWAATLNEYGLYAVLIVQPLTGLGDTLLRGRPFALFLWQVPALVHRDKSTAALSHHWHEAGALALLALLAAHILAALLHWLVWRDGVFQRMAPGAPPARRR